jgi:hypothetical protein
MPTLAIGDFSTHCWLIDWPELVVAINDEEVRLRNQGRTVAADMLLVAYREFTRGLELLAVDLAAWGTKRLKEMEKATRVRPDTDGNGGPRLGNYLRCEVLIPNIIPGTIGINDEAYLDAHVPWWITNEIGNSTNVGRQIWGLFYQGADPSTGEPPRPDLQRVHPLFEPAPWQAGGGFGVIAEPIPARHFIERAAAEIREKWLEGIQLLKLAMNDRLVIAAHTFR